MATLFSNDGRILTPPKELEPLLKGAFPAFFKLLGHIRFFYVVNEIWDGKTSLVFNTNGEQLAVVTLGDSVFHIFIADEDFQIVDESMLDGVYDALKKTASDSQRRPEEQLTVDLDEYPNGIRCDLCILEKRHNENDFTGSRKFAIMDRHCYHGVEEGWGEGIFSPSYCEGKQGCYAKTYTCLEKKGFNNCLECGEYRTCGDCGVGHNPGECNLGITAEEVTNLIIPYCEVERLDLLWEKKMSYEIFSRCGNRCDLCLIYRPNVVKEDRRVEICAVWDKLGSQKYDPSIVICDGCMADNKDAVLFSSNECKTRKCVIEKGLEHCGFCPFLFT